MKALGNFSYLGTCILIIMMTSCGASGPEPMAAAVEAPAEAPAAKSADDISDASSIQVDIPTGEQITRIIEAAENAVLPELRHVPAPSQRVAILQTILATLVESGNVINPECCDVFDEKRTVTYALPDAGALFQLVALATPLDELLGNPQLWENEGLAVGGMFVYQDFEYRVDRDGTYQTRNYEIAGLPAGNYIVVLQQDGSKWTFELYNEALSVLGSGDWQLRESREKAETTRSFITPQQICFAHQEYQACLNIRSPEIGEGANRGIIEEAIGDLLLRGILIPESGINVDDALASVTGSESVQTCFNAFVETDVETDAGVPAQCRPSLVLAAGDPVPIEQLEPVLRDSSTTDDVVPIVGAAVLTALQDISDGIFDSNGQPAVLIQGNYRVDFIFATEKKTWLSQFVPVDEVRSPIVYAIAQEVAVQGELIGGDDEPTRSDVVLSSVVIRPCRSDGTESECSSLFCRTDCRKRPIYLNRDWCD